MENEEIKKIWEEVKVELEKTIPTSFYELWISQLEPVGFENNQFSLLTGHALAIQLIRQNHYAQIKDAFQKVLGKDVEFNINYDNDFAQKRKKEKIKAARATKKKEVQEVFAPVDNLSKMQSSSNLNLKYKFENFVVGENSRFAYAVAMAV